jgi:fatty acid omega-hydroxylase
MPSFFQALAMAFDTATKSTLQCLLYAIFLWRLGKIFSIRAERRLKESLQFVKNYMNDAITVRKESMLDDLLSRFINKRDVDGKTFSMSVLQRIALNFVLADRDTLLVVLSWFFWLIMHYSEVEDKIVKEISMVLNNKRGAHHRKWVQEPLVFDEADQLVYLKAKLAETLHLFLSVPKDFKYIFLEDVLPKKTSIPADSTVTYSIYSVGRTKSIWGEDCMEFKLDRWLSADGDRFEPPQDVYKFMAFNAEPRTWLTCK